jgi:hypothetical protein
MAKSQEDRAARLGLIRTRREDRTARLGLIGTVVAALIAAVIGGVVAGVFAYATANRQLTGETERSRAEFLRGQRQTAYSTFLAERWTLFKSEEELFLSFELPPADNSYVVGPETKIQLHAAGEDTSSELLKFNAAQMTIEVIGSPAVVEASEDLTLQYDEIAAWLTDAGTSAIGGEPIDSRAMTDTYHHMEQVTIPTLSRFLKAARADMGVEVSPAPPT